MGLFGVNPSGFPGHLGDLLIGRPLRRLLEHPVECYEGASGRRAAISTTFVGRFDRDRDHVLADINGCATEAVSGSCASGSPARRNLLPP